MTLILYWEQGGQSHIYHVTEWRWVDDTTVEVQTYGNHPNLNKRVADVEEILTNDDYA